VKEAALAFLILTGWASQYGPGVAERVIAVRQGGRTAATLPANLPEVDGFIAVRECPDIGGIWLLRPEGAQTWERFLVIDCASRSDHQSEQDPRSGWEWMVGGGIVAEVDFETAKRWGTIGRGIRVEYIPDWPKGMGGRKGAER